MGDAVSNDPFFRHLIDLAQRERTRAKWVFVPYATLKWTLGERLLLAGQNWANFRFATPFEVALETAAPRLLARGVNPKPEALGPSLVHKLLLELPASVPPYFRPLLSQPGTAEAMWTTLQEIRMAGLRCEDVRKHVAGDKGTELAALVGAYEQYLLHHKLADRATVFQEPCGIDPIQPEDLVVEFPWKWRPLERAFLDRHPRVEPGPARAAPLVQAELRLFRAGRRDAEIVEVLRRIRGVPADTVEIGLADPDSLPLLRDKLAAAGVPTTFENGLPIGYSRPGQAIAGLLAWVEHRYAAFDLRQLLLADLLTIGNSRLESGFAAHYLERARATWERETYPRSLGSLKAWLRDKLAARADDPRQVESLNYQLDMLSLLGDWIEELFSCLPLHGEVSAWVKGLQRILEAHVATPSPADESARRRLARWLQELLLLEGQRWPLEDTVRLLREKLQTLTFGASRAIAGHVHVTTLDRLGLSGRRDLFVLGLEEGRLHFEATEDPVLSDAERQALHPGLVLSEQRASEARTRVLERLACVDGRLTMSYSTREMTTGQEQLPSWLFLEAARQLRTIESLEELEAWLGEPAIYAPTDPAESAGECEWWLARLPRLATGREQAVLDHFPFLAAGAEAVRERRSERFTRFDGFAPSAAGKLDPRRTGEPTSASRLECLATCPFKFFLESGLRIRPPALERPDPDRWLDEAARGKLLHEVFAAYHRHLRRLKLRPEVERDAPLLEGLLHEQLQLRRSVLPPPSEAIAHNETRALQRDLDRFLRLEARCSDREPLGLEVGFGLPELYDEPLAQLAPVELDLGEDMRFRLRGRIDRLDRMREGIEVVDYKTGRRYVSGRQLQHALYALAAEQLLGDETVLGSSYYFPVSQAEQERVRMGFPDRDRLRRLLLDMMEPLATGAFVHTERVAEDCPYCDLQAACRSKSEPPSRAMLDDPALAYRRRIP